MWCHFYCSCKNKNDFKTILGKTVCQQIWQPQWNGKFSYDTQTTKTGIRSKNLNSMITSKEIELVIKTSQQ